MKRKTSLLLLSCLVSLIIFNGCNSMKNAMNINGTTEQADYSEEYCWVAKAQTIDKAVDVFYIYPTIYLGKDPKNMDISDPSLRDNAKGLIVAQGGGILTICQSVRSILPPAIGGTSEYGGR